MRVAPVEQRRKKYLILPRWTGAAGSPLCYCYWHVCDSHIYATRETERFPIFPKDPASKTPLPEFSGLRMRDGEARSTSPYLIIVVDASAHLIFYLPAGPAH